MTVDATIGGGLIRTAIKSVPVIKYALGLAAMAILVSIARSANPEIGVAGMVPVILGTLVLMVLLIIVAAVSESKSALAGPAVLITWSASIALVVVLAASVSAMLVGWPERWADLILPKAVADKPLIGSAAQPQPNPSITISSVRPSVAKGDTQTSSQQRTSVNSLNNHPVDTTKYASPAIKTFDCMKAAMPLDWVICTDSESYELNTQMGSIWETAHRQMNAQERSTHVKEQLNWIYSTQRECGLPVRGKPDKTILAAAVSCVRTAYSARIAVIKH